ncbi:MAG TPA: lytic transglycosylase domain-containing protein [Acetobacteraceae bacterium]|nr:lytic transglycosylase domain-containing protein [Acetobacteraceae bacterium]
MRPSILIACLFASPAFAMPTVELPTPSFGLLPDVAPPANAARATLWPLVRAEALRQGVPPALADAVAIVETGYTTTSVGASGEIGMMQVMPATARMLGFSGDLKNLFDPATNIHYGVTYLAHAWEASGGNACRALMKYRAGVAEDGFSPLSIQYCRRAAAWLRTQDAVLAQNVTTNTPLIATLSDPGGISINGHPYFHPDLAGLVAIADIPGMEIEHTPAHAAAASAPPLIRQWHISARGRRIQAVVDAALSDSDDTHEIHVPEE